MKFRYLIIDADNGCQISGTDDKAAAMAYAAEGDGNFTVIDAERQAVMDEDFTDLYDIPEAEGVESEDDPEGEEGGDSNED